MLKYGGALSGMPVFKQHNIKRRRSEKRRDAVGGELSQPDLVVRSLQTCRRGIERAGGTMKKSRCRTPSVGAGQQHQVITDGEQFLPNAISITGGDSGKRDVKTIARRMKGLEHPLVLSAVSRERQHVRQFYQQPSFMAVG